MAKRSAARRKPQPAPAPEPEIAAVPETTEAPAEPVRRSIVKSGYKRLYASRGTTKAAKRSCWDWLAQELATECLIGTKISIDRFLRVLEANGVDHSRWTNRSPGWEGRLRMTGRLALQKVVAAQGHLVTADGGTLEAPAEWVAKHTH